MLVTLLAAAAAMAGHLPGCLPQDQAGMVVDVTGSTPAGKSAPYLSRQDQSAGPTDGQLLCPDDVIVNPAGSGVTIRYKLSGHGMANLAAGGSNVSVPAAGFQAQFAMLSDRVRNTFDSLAFRTSGVRGGDESPRLLFPLPAQIFAVPTWGPLILAWNGTSTGEVVIHQGPKVRTLTGQGRLAIDLAADCQASCTVNVRIPAGPAFDTTITTLTAAEAMAELDIAQLDGDPPPVVIAAWFGASQQDPAWRLQQASLLWSAACGYPAFGALARATYALTTDPDTCDDTAGPSH